MQKHEAIFRGKIMEKKHYSWFGYGVNERKVFHNIVLKELKDFYSTTMDAPILNEGDFLYIDDLEIDAEVEVLRVVRSLGGEYIYYVDYVIETIENEEKRRELEKEVEEIKEKQEEYLREVARIREEEESKKLKNRLLKFLGMKG